MYALQSAVIFVMGCTLVQSSKRGAKRRISEAENRSPVKGGKSKGKYEDFEVYRNKVVKSVFGIDCTPFEIPKGTVDLLASLLANDYLVYQDQGYVSATNIVLRNMLFKIEDERVFGLSGYAAVAEPEDILGGKQFQMHRIVENLNNACSIYNIHKTSNKEFIEKYISQYDTKTYQNLDNWEMGKYRMEHVKKLVPPEMLSNFKNIFRKNNKYKQEYWQTKYPRVPKEDVEKLLDYDVASVVFRNINTHFQSTPLDKIKFELRMPMTAACGFVHPCLLTTSFEYKFDVTISGQGRHFKRFNVANF